MRVIGISKRWRGQKGTQPHPENLIGESLEAQHSKGESLLNYTVYAYIPTYASFILRSVSILSLFQRLFLITQEAVETSAIQTSLFFQPSAHHHFLTFHSPLHFLILFTLTLASCFYLFIDSFSNFTYFFPFHFVLTFSYKPPALGFH